MYSVKCGISLTDYVGKTFVGVLSFPLLNFPNYIPLDVNIPMLSTCYIAMVLRCLCNMCERNFSLNVILFLLPYCSHLHQMVCSVVLNVFFFQCQKFHMMKLYHHVVLNIRVNLYNES